MGTLYRLPRGPVSPQVRESLHDEIDALITRHAAALARDGADVAAILEPALVEIAGRYALPPSARGLVREMLSAWASQRHGEVLRAVERWADSGCVGCALAELRACPCDHHEEP